MYTTIVIFLNISLVIIKIKHICILLLIEKLFFSGFMRKKKKPIDRNISFFFIYGKQTVFEFYMLDAGKKKKTIKQFSP